MMNYLVDYSKVNNALQQLDAEMDASEAHGTLCGLICAEKNLLADEWYAFITPASDNTNLLVEEAKTYLAHLHQYTTLQLNDPECGFQLLLPEDDAALELRVLSLSEWCQGFLVGLSMGGIFSLDTLPDQSADISKNLLEIAMAGSKYYVEYTQDDEHALQELIEFVRVGVMLVNEEMNPTGAISQQPLHTLH